MVTTRSSLYTFPLKKIFQWSLPGSWCVKWNGFKLTWVLTSTRVEHQKLNQVGAEPRVFGVQLGLRQTKALVKTKTIKRGNVPPAILLLC